MVNGFVVAVFSLVVGGLIVGIDVPAGPAPPFPARDRDLVTFSCTGFGLIGRRARPADARAGAVLANIMFGILLVFTGANVPIDQLPGWMQTISSVLPFTHGIEAAREIADGASLAEVRGLLLDAEAAIGVVYAASGYSFIRNAERLSLRHATLDRN